MTEPSRFKPADEDIDLGPEPKPEINDIGKARAYLAAAIEAIDEQLDQGLVTPDRVFSPTEGNETLTGVVFDPVQGWTVYSPIDTQYGRWVYVHTPTCMFNLDVVPLSPSDARRLAAALVAAAGYVESDLWRRRDPKTWLAGKPKGRR